MRRISTATKVTDKFGAGKHGFTNGNAALGTAATDLEDQWFDHVQEELANVIEAAGIAVDGSVRTQLLSALRAAGVFQTPTTGDRSTKAATTQMFSNEFLASKAANGYQKLPSGLIIQWGEVRATAPTAPISQNADITFPIAFPNAAFQISVSCGVATPDLDGNAAWRPAKQTTNVGTPTKTGCECVVHIENSTGQDRNLSYIVIGY